MKLLTKHEARKSVLTLTQAAILDEIEKYCKSSEDGYFHQPASYIADILGYTDAAIINSIKRLVVKGYLSTKRKQDYKRLMLKPSKKYYDLLK